MKVSLNWLKDYIDLDQSPDEIIAKLNLIGLMVEEKHQVDDDVILDLETYPNRPDTLGHIGIARELAACYQRPLKEKSWAINWLDEQIEDLIDIKIVEEQLCPRYIGLVVRDLKVGPSPEWLQKRLESLGVRSINNVVDVANYVLFLTAHPIHTFDLNKIEGKKVIIRKASLGEKIITLEGEQEILSSEMLVIADSKKPIAIAGVIGGEESGVTEETKDILIESAYFDPISIRKTSKVLGLSTEASYRFERGADVEFSPKAAQIAASLLSSFGGKVAKGMIDIYPQPRKKRTVIFRLKRTSEILGLSLDKGFIEKTFDQLGFKIKKSQSEIWQIEIPSYRVDIEREIDLIEEVARFYGYDKIPSTLPQLKITESILNPKRERIDQLRLKLISLGFDEVINYSFTDPKQKTLFNNNLSPITIRNPISMKASQMRTTLLGGLLENIVWNKNRGAEGVQIFEIGRIYFWENERPKEQLFLSMVGAGLYQKKHWQIESQEIDFFLLKGAVEAIIDQLKYYPFSFEIEDHNYFELGYSLGLVVKGEKVGWLGLIKKEIRESYELKEKVFGAEINLELLIDKVLPPFRFKPISRFPQIKRDISFLVDKKVTYNQIEQEIAKIANPLLREFELYDRYFGSSIPPDKISMTLRFTYSHVGRTLLAEEVQVVHNQIVEHLKNKFKIKLRE
ncbi:MAG: phenylalanine--tRNA ligase subunit beta [Candidatus Aminicenantia bacterium]